jgi:hypothetical protein
MIDIQQYEKILNSGLLLDHYLVLCNIRDGREQPKSKRIQGFINLLSKKGYLEDGTLTLKGAELTDLRTLEITKTSSTTTTTTTVQEESSFVEETQLDFAEWVKVLHKKCQSKIHALRGTKQIRDKIQGKSYSFLPNSTDLMKVLYRVITIYKLQDFDAIERCILGYIEKCHRANNWFPILQYYIMKDKFSKLVTDLEDDNGDKEDGDQQNVSITII